MNKFYPHSTGKKTRFAKVTISPGSQSIFKGWTHGYHAGAAGRENTDLGAAQVPV